MNYKHNFILFPVLILVLVAGCQSQGSKSLKDASQGRNYYLSPSGNDENPGSINKPWKSLEKINASEFKPGDSILLEGGAVFTGTLRLDSLDSGLENRKVIIGSYGKGRATIFGANSEGIIVRDCNYFIINDLIVKGSGRKEGNSTDGIYITRSGYFDIDSLELYGFQHSGLLVHIGSNLRITNVYAHGNGFAGIHVTGTTMNDPINYDNENIYIGYCTAGNNPGDPTVTDNHSGNGILVSSARGGTIEYCEAFNNGWDMPWGGNGPVGIWIWDCTKFVIQYCIAHDNKTKPGAGDGGGFDLDGGVSNSVIQYCLSYNNQGAGYGLFEFGAAKAWENNIIRYNISENDAIFNTGSLAVWKNETGGTMRNCEIYNNTFYNNTERGFAISFYNNWPGFSFRNNVFIYRDSFLIPGQKLVAELFQGNCFWSLSGDQSIAGYKNLDEWAKETGNEKLDGKVVGLFADPGLQNPGSCSMTDPRKLDTKNLADYCPKSASPLIDRGLDLKMHFNLTPGTKDIAGSAIPQGKAFDVGALEKPDGK